ncbi:MAG TPA: biotin-dependent carboxyltransferase family protein [Pseudoneobacillus sp.]|nr:biotin-dependent carboxyltransferase family protein [Pseudoneobacillus sp.]
MGVMVYKPGLLSTVQDLGRYGYQQDGIIVSGAMDSFSMRLANLLVGNEDNDAVLEVTLIGPSLHFLVDSVIAICGGNLSPTINQIPISLNKPILVKKGDQVEFGPVKYGCRCYIAFKGGIHVKKVLGSNSTCLPAGFGGFNGRPLTKGDVLPIKTIHFKFPLKLNWQVSTHFNSFLFSDKPIRYLKGRQYDLFTEESRYQFKTSPFILTKDSNRMGFRIEGTNLKLTNQQEMLTEGVTFGSVQIPASGQPIILMADRQTTGGYPKIAQVISTDLPRLAQLKPGDHIYFTEISLLEAQQLAYKAENELRILRKMMMQKWKASEL